jgi:hypothetical protein
VLTLAGGAVGLAAVRFVPRSRRSPGADGPPGRADWTVALVLGGLGACLALVANPFSALLLVPALHAWVLLPRLPRSGAAGRLALVWLPLVLPALAVAADLRLSPLDLVGAVGSQVLPGATALGLALGLAAAVLLTPVALGLSTAARPGTTRRESAATV